MKNIKISMPSGAAVTVFHLACHQSAPVRSLTPMEHTLSHIQQCPSDTGDAGANGYASLVFSVTGHPAVTSFSGLTFSSFSSASPVVTTLRYFQTRLSPVRI